MDLDMRGRDFSDAMLQGAVFERCDLTGSKSVNAQVANARFINCILSDCSFGGAHVGVDFSGSDLRGSKMKGIYQNCHFGRCNLKGADFGGAQFNEGNTFQDVEFDETTSFEKTKGMRALSRLPLFQYFVFERGMFVRSNTSLAALNDSAQPPLRDEDYEVSKPLISVQLARNSGNVRLMARSLAIAIDDQLADLPKPNDPVALERYNSFVGIMTQVRDGLAEISQLLEVSDTKGPEFEPAASVVAQLRARVATWLGDNSEVVFGYGMKTGLLGAGCALLTYCGAPGWQAFPALAFMLGGSQLTDTFRHKKSDGE